MAGNIKQYGTGDGSSLILQAGSPSFEQIGSRAWKITYVWRCAMANVLNLKPAWHAECPMSSFTDHQLTGLSITGLGDPPGWCEVVATYTYEQGITAVSRNVPGTSGAHKSATVSSQRVSLDDANISTLITDADELAAMRKTHKALNLAAPEYSYTAYYEVEDFDWTESNLTRSVNNMQVGEFGSPFGLTSVSVPELWMFTGRSIREDGDLVETTDTWKYNRLGWK